MPLAPSQESQWEFMSALSPEDPGRSRIVVIDNLHMYGSLDESALRMAFVDVLRRHDTLRMVFDHVGPDPLVRIRDDAELPVDFLDLTAVGEKCRRDRIDELVYLENRRSFDLRNGPLWHATVSRIDHTTHLLTLCFSHMVADGYGPKVFITDLLTAYGARIGTAPPLVDDAPSFEEVRDMQTRRLTVTADRLEYWRSALVPFAVGTHAEPRLVPGANLLTRSRLPFDFSAEVAAALKRVAWRARTTPFVVMMAAYHVLLSVETGTDRTVVSTATLGRTTQRAWKAVAQFASDPYVATDLPDDLTLGDAVVVTHDTLAEATANLVPYTAMARAVNPGFDQARPWPDIELCDGNIYSQAYRHMTTEIAGVRVNQVFITGRVPEPEHIAPEMLSPAWLARCGPSVEIGMRRDGGALLYNADVYPTDAMREIVERYTDAVTVLATQPDLTVRALRKVLA
nr:Probable non-ribosomal peptide synthetase [Kibdelosporangium sp. MJ126-NF4]CTQ98692.1 Probable non-ribosomal peptide synthetase [Kibdelosporangium sp. MJ126-NF4]